ncbi:MAG: ABC transporter ATP-binding protein [Sphingomonas sp.]
MALTVDRLAVTLGGRTVLRDVSARFEPGRVTAILGPNGAGKSTLVKAMAALTVPRSGMVCVGDDDVATLHPRERARRIGYLPQGATAAWNVPVADLVAIGRLPYRTPFAAASPADRAAIERAMMAADVADLAFRPIGELSGGERSRVFLARVLAGEPEWLLADEPLAALDPAHQIDMLDRLRDVARRGGGVVIVLHDLALAAQMADDALLLADGQVVAGGPVSSALTPDAIARVFGIRADWIEHGGVRRLVPFGRIS